MQAEQLDVDIEELEMRLERLRALYEQYFIGIEKIEPAIARKDVDRRIWALRKEKIRNTAKRFKLQTIIQRYNTYQQHWHRILREIELGTFHRHVRKAALITGADLLTTQSRKRHKHTLKAQTEENERAALHEASARQASEAAPAPSPHPRTSRPPPNAGILPRPGVSAGRRPSQAPPDASSGQRPQTLPGTTVGALLGQNNSEPQVAPAPQRRAPLPTQPGARMALGGADAAPRPPPPRQPTPPLPLAPAKMAPPLPLPPAKMAPPSLPNIPRAAAPAAAAPAPRPPPPRAAAQAHLPSAAEIARPRLLPATPDQSLSENRIQQLHERLIAARRQAGDATETSLPGLARSLRATEAKLRAEHQGREIDFDVALKDGKAVLRPILKKSNAD